MEFYFPGLFSFQYRHASKNHIAQLRTSESLKPISGHTEYDKGKIKGYVLTLTDDEEVFVAVNSRRSPKKFSKVISVYLPEAATFNEIAQLNCAELMKFVRHHQWIKKSPSLN